MASDTGDPVDKLKETSEEGIDKVAGKGEESGGANPKEVSTDEETIDAEQKASEVHDR